MIKIKNKTKNIILLICIGIFIISSYFIYKYIENLNYKNIVDYETKEDEKSNQDKINNKNTETESDKGIENAEDLAIQENKLEKENTEESNKIVIHILGEVVNSGVYELKENSRVIDAVNIAGGLTDLADVSEINLAYILSDETRIYIPNINEKKEETVEKYITQEVGNNITERNDYKESKKENLKVNINEATQTELETLPGIGPSIALKIIKYREENGNYNNLEDIKNVSGIGDSKFENIKDLICI